MAITTRNELITAVRNFQEWDSSFTDARINECISLTEDMINGDLMQPVGNAAGGVNRQLTTTTGNISTEATALPSDFLGSKTIYITTGGDNLVLSYMTPESLQLAYGNNTGARPEAFTIIGSSFYVRPVPDASYPYTLIYFARVPALSDSVSTNWVLTYFPNAYLYGTLVQASVYLMDDARAKGTFAPLYDQAIERIRQDSNRATFPTSNLSMSLDFATP